MLTNTLLAILWSSVRALLHQTRRMVRCKQLKIANYADWSTWDFLTTFRAII